MKFKIGEKVIVRRTKGGSKDKYFYDNSLRDIPLGSKGIVIGYCEDHYQIKIRGSNYCLIDKEIEAQNGAEESSRNRLDALLTGSFSDKSMDKKEPTKKREFDPKFNAKDEFPVWVRQEFPDLKMHSKNRGKYKALSRRIGEVKEAASEAWKGVAEVTGGKHCHRDFLRQWFNEFETAESNKYVAALENLTRALELSGKESFPYTYAIERFRGR